MTVYDNAAAFPVDEEDAVEPLAAGYARGKWMAEQRLFRRHRPGDVALRLPGLFGLPRRSGVLYNAAKAFLTFGRFELAAPPRLWAAMAVEDAAEYLVRAATMPSESPAQAVNVGYEGEFNIASAVAEVAACCGTEWQAPAVDVKMFSMRLQRLESRYGRPAVTFGQRVQEFVHAVRRDLASASAARVSAR
jgi:nucleoside-diphosphate-sugar epimerase